MTYEEFKTGLKKRGFIGIDKISEIGQCHKDEKHYILYSDETIIYSTKPFWNNILYLKNEKYIIWDFSDWAGPENVFTFQKLEMEMSNMYKNDYFQAK